MNVVLFIMRPFMQPCYEISVRAPFHNISVGFKGNQLPNPKVFSYIRSVYHTAVQTRIHIFGCFHVYIYYSGFIYTFIWEEDSQMYVSISHFLATISICIANLLWTHRLINHLNATETQMMYR